MLLRDVNIGGRLFGVGSEIADLTLRLLTLSKLTGATTVAQYCSPAAGRSDDDI
jgi:hypothetical protein